MALSRFGRRTLPWIVFTFAVVFGCATAVAATAQPQVAEESYRSFLVLYRQDKPTTADLQKALGFLETANRLTPNNFKYVYSLGAVNNALARWDDACRWLEKAQPLGSTAQQKTQIRTEIDYCQAQIAKARVGTWGGEGVSISFIMKAGTAEMAKTSVEALPKRLPVVNVGDSPRPIEDALRQRFVNLNSGLLSKDIFMIAGVQDSTPPETYYLKGIRDFYNYFKAEYFEQLPQRPVVVLISSQPYSLVDATRKLYPEAQIREYAPFLGYYNPADNLIMATGGSTGYGTLLHEMIHALMQSDFPNAPPWLNEGLASLYERTQWNGARLNALPNWRLDRMREDNVRSLLELGRKANEIGLNSDQIGEIRLFLLFLDKGHQVNALYRMAKQKGSAFSLENAITDLGLKETEWRSFLKNVFREYRAELSLSQSASYNPDDVRFVQLALSRTMGIDMMIDGFWGSATQERLIDFQKTYGLDPDGILGPKTISELRRQYSLREMKLIESVR